MASLVILDKDKLELKDIDRKVEEDGFKQDLSTEHKLRYLWRCWQRSEGSLKSALEDVEALRRQHAEEMIEVENYVSHIQQLSEEREALTYEFESENEQLKVEIENQKQELAKFSSPAMEITKVLAKRGHHFLVSTPINEQLEKLVSIVEDDLVKIHGLETENDKLQADSKAASTKMLDVLDNERAGMEKEIAQLKEKILIVQKEEKEKFDKELTKVKDEKAFLQNSVNENAGQIKSLSNETLQLNKVLEKERQAHQCELAKMKEVYQENLKMALNDPKQQQEKEEAKQQIKTLQCEIKSLKEQLSVVVEEKKTLKDLINQLEEDLWAEKQNWDKTFQESESALQTERKTLAEKQNQLENVETEKSYLQGAKTHLEEVISQLNKEVEELKRKESLQDAQATKERADKEEVTQSLIELSNEKKKLTLKVSELGSVVSQKETWIESLQQKLEEKEQSLKQIVANADIQEKQAQDKLTQLKKKMTTTEADLETMKTEFDQTTQNYEEALSALRVQELSLKEKIDKEHKENETLKTKVEYLDVTLSKLRKQTDESSVQQATNDRRLQFEIDLITKEKEELNRGLKVEIEMKKQKEAELAELKEQAHQLSEENKSLRNTLESLEKKTEELTRKEADYAEIKEEVDRLSEENKSLRHTSEALEKKTEELTRKEVEVSLLKENTQELNEENGSLKFALQSLEKHCENLSRQITISETEMKNQEEAISRLSESNEKLTNELTTAMTNLTETHSEMGDLRKELEEARDEVNFCKNSSLNSQADLNKTMQELRKGLKDKEGEQRSQQTIISKIKEENFELKTSIKELEKEIQDSESEKNTLTAKNRELLEKFAEGEMIKRSLEAKIAVTESDLSYLKGQSEFHSTEAKKTEASLKNLEKDLEEKNAVVRNLEASARGKQFENSTLIVERDSLKERLINSEKQIVTLNGQIDTLRQELEKATLDLEDTVKTMTALTGKSNEVIVLKKSLDEETKNRTMLTETIKELENQVFMLEKDRADYVDKYNQTNTLLSEKEQSLLTLQKQQKEATKEENSKKNPTNDINKRVELLKTENLALKAEVAQAVGECDTLKTKYDEKKIQAYSKLQALRERYSRERKAFEMFIRQLQNSLSVTKNQLEKEAEWKKEAEESQRKILSEKTILSSKIMSLEEKLRDSNRELRQHKLREAVLEEENLEIRDKLRIGIKEQQNLERCLREFVEREMFGGNHNRRKSSDARLTLDAYLNILKPGAGLGRRPSPGPGEATFPRRGPDGNVSTGNINFARSGTSSGFMSPVEDRF